MEWMAPQQPAQPHSDSPRHAIPLNGFHHVLRAGGMKPARRRQPPGRSTACRYEGWSARVAFFDQLNHLASNRPERRFQQCPARIEHDVPFRRELSAVQTERFAQAALDAVAKHRFSDRSRHGEPDARAQLFLWSCAGQACACFCFGRACVVESVSRALQKAANKGPETRNP